MSRPRAVPAGPLALFGSLYAIQGIVISYFFNFNQGYMADAGVSEAAIGTMRSVALLPLVLRFLGGPLSDRVNLLGLGHRKPYIVLGLVVQTIGLAGLALVHPDRHVSGYTAVAFLTVVGLALYDTATDGMILDATRAEDRPKLQGGLIAARFVAAMATSLGFGVWLGRTGNGPGRGDGAIWACAALGLVPLALALVLPEPRRVHPDAEEFNWAALGALVRPHALLLLAFGLLYALVSYAVEINLSPYYHRLGFGEQDVGVFGATRYVGRAAGALALGVADRRLGRRRVLALGILLLAASTFGQAAVTGRASAGVLALLFGTANGWCDALFYVLAMEASDPRMAASTCALFMSVTNLSVLGGAVFARGVATAGGRYRPVFEVAAGIVLLALVFVRPLGRTLTAENPAPRDENHDPGLTN